MTFTGVTFSDPHHLQLHAGDVLFITDTLQVNGAWILNWWTYYVGSVQTLWGARRGRQAGNNKKSFNELMFKRQSPKRGNEKKI